MPRKNPVPFKEIEICQRLKDIRALARLSRIVFAQKAGISAGLLRSYENGKSRLNYQAAFKLIIAWGINPEWLATGNGRWWATVSIPGPEELKVGPRALFSAVYAQHLASAQIAAMTSAKQKPNVPDPLPIRLDASNPIERVVAETRLVNWLKRLVLCVPDAQFEKVINYIYVNGTKFARKSGADTDEHFQKRLDAMELARASMFQRKQRIKNDLTKAATLDEGAAVQNQWLRLKRRLQRATAVPGQKTALAIFLSVDLTQLSRWLSDSDSAREPGAGYALKMLHWVQQHEERKIENKNPSKRSSAAGATDPENINQV